MELLEEALRDDLLMLYILDMSNQQDTQMYGHLLQLLNEAYLKYPGRGNSTKSSTKW